MNSEGFYRAFEERYRGSRKLIGQRLEAYLPFIKPLKTICQPTQAVDLGCGRGEWLELLGREGFEAHGVDLDAGMLAACTERGLSVTQGEAIAYLKSLPDESRCVVSGFHIAEHIDFDVLEVLVIESLRVLRPGGLLILETPNPENIIVGTSSFYLDPTHLRPLPPLLLSFLPEHHGYHRVKIVRLQEAKGLAERDDAALIEVLEGVSPDYSVIAQKTGPSELLEPFDVAFAASYGVELRALADRHDASARRGLATLEQRVAAVESSTHGLTDALTHNAALQDKLVAASVEAARSAEHVAQLNAQREDAERQTRASQAVIDELEAKHAAQLAQIEALLTDRESQREAAEHQARAGQTAIDELESKHAAQSTQIEALVADRGTLSTQLSEHREEAARQAQAHQRTLDHLATQHALQLTFVGKQLDDVNQRVQIEQSRADQLGGSSHHWWLIAQALEAEVKALRASWSWRVSQPLRWGANLLVKTHPQPPEATVGAGPVGPITDAMRVVLANPELAARVNRQLLRYPPLHRRLRSLAQRRGLMPDAVAGSPMSGVADTGLDNSNARQLTPYARATHAALKQAVEVQRQKESG